MSDNEIGQSLECSIPASIAIEEMIVGRLTSKQLGFVCVGAALAYNFMFKVPNHIIGWTLGVLVVALVYFLGFYKMKKYDTYMYEYWYYQFKFRMEQQIFINK